MLFCNTDEKLKAMLEHDIEWNEKQINSIEKWIKESKEWLKRTSDAKTIKSLQDGIANSKDTIKAHRGFIANSQERYAQGYGNRYGAQKLTLIKGGLYEPSSRKINNGLSDEFLGFMKVNA